MSITTYVDKIGSQTALLICEIVSIATYVNKTGDCFNLSGVS